MNSFRHVKFSVLALIALAQLAFVAPCWARETGFHQGQWPFTPLSRPGVPTTKRSDWSHNAVDQFVLAEMEKRGLQPNTTADRATLLRRVTFDLTGLPPTTDDLRSFLNDPSSLAYEHVVDRLLSSPRFGERWSRHWLDVVRFADTSGFKHDYLRTEMYRYRDYVIDAFDTDLPFNTFVQQQLAGDEIDPHNNQAIVATGMLRLYSEETTASDFVKQRQDILDDITDTTSLTFLGLTMGCAQCHDHKFDPILQSDFYRMQACFAGTIPADQRPLPAAGNSSMAEQRRRWEEATNEIRTQLDSLKAHVEERVKKDVSQAYDAETRAAWYADPALRTTRQRQLVGYSSYFMQKTLRRRLNRLEGEEAAKYEDLQTQLAKFDHLKPAEVPTALAVEDGLGPVPVTHVLATGDYRKPEEEVGPGYPEFLGGEAGAVPSIGNAGGRRSALARWLTLPEHPLTTRVMVNRLWQHHFGQGIVPSSNDFGAMGESASHPKLLDYLASELVANQWSLKSIHRLMVTSATYQQSSFVDETNDAQQSNGQVDPENKFLWHARRMRLDAEPLRDSLLMLSGQLHEQLGGPSTYPLLSAAVSENSAYAWSPDDVDSQRTRRSIYTIQKRNLRLPFLASYDQPDMYLSCGVRSLTLTPTQSLTLLNGDDATDAARLWAGRLLAEHHGDDQHLVRTAWREAYSREATDEEVAHALKFFALQSQSVYDHEIDIPTRSLPQPLLGCLQPHVAAAYVDFCHALLNSSEFLYID